MKKYNLVQGPHLLYAGAKGRKTYGITLETIESNPALQRTWNLNDRVICGSDSEGGTEGWLMEYVGMTEEEATSLVLETAKMAKEQL